MATTFNIGFLGAGKMATALARGFIRAELVGPKEIIAGDPVDAARKHFAAEIGANGHGIQCRRRQNSPTS